MHTHPVKTCSRLMASLLAASIVLLIVMWPGMPYAQATDSGSTPITWSVAPATAEGLDGRGWVDLEVDPGQVIHDYLSISNLSDINATFQVTVGDGYYTNTGRFNMLESSQQSTGAGTWIGVVEEVAVPAGQSITVPFTITVPENATPGDRGAGIAASVLTTGASASGSQLQVESRMGFKVLLRVSGTLTPSAVVENVHSKYLMSWNPLRPGAIEVQFVVRNTGNTRLSLEGTVSATGATNMPTGNADKPGPTAPTTVLLPGEERMFTATLTKVWPLFLAHVSVLVDAHVPPQLHTAKEVEGAASFETVAPSTMVMTIPWPQVMVLGGVALLVLSMMQGRRRRQAAVDKLVAHAHREGQLSAQQR